MSLKYQNAQSLGFSLLTKRGCCAELVKGFHGMIENFTAQAAAEQCAAIRINHKLFAAALNHFQGLCASLFLYAPLGTHIFLQPSTE